MTTTENTTENTTSEITPTPKTRAEKLAEKGSRAAEAKAIADRAEAKAIADELVALKVDIKGISSNQSNAVDGLVARIRALGVDPPAPAEG